MINSTRTMASGLALLVAAAGAAPAATVFIPEGSADRVLMVEAETGEVVRVIEGVEAVHGLAGAPGVKYLVAGSFAEVDVEEVVAVAKPEGISEDEHAKHHAKPAASAMPKDAGVSILTVLDAATGDPVRRIEVPGAVHHTAVSPDGRYAVATHPAGDGISIIDLEALAFKAFLPTGSMPNYAAFSPDGATVYVSNTGNGTVSEVAIEKGIVKRNFEAGEAPEHFVLSADAGKLYAVDADAGITREVDTATGETARSFEIGGELHGVDLSADGKTLFVTGKGENKLVAIDLASGAQKTAPLAPAPYHLTTIADTGKLFVSSRDEPKVWIVDQQTLAAAGEIAVEGEGHQMVVLP